MVLSAVLSRRNMSARWKHFQPIALGFLLVACLPLAAVASATPSITLSKKIGPPTSRILVSGHGFRANAKIDLYFGTQDEAVVFADGSGAFLRAAIPAPASALPGAHWVSAVERDEHAGAQARFDVETGWRQFHRRDMARWNRYENVLNVHNVRNLQVKWSYLMSDYGSAPAVANGVVYVGSDDHNFYALNASTGALLWSYDIGVLGTNSAPAVENGVVYVGSGNGILYAFDASTGVPLWTFATDDYINSSPTVVNGVVYVGSHDGHLYAVNAATGAEIWAFQAANGYWGRGVDTSPAVVNGVVYFGSDDYNVYALNASTGAELWSYTTPYIVWSSPAVANGVVYVGANTSVYALNAKTGAKLWSYDTGSGVQSSPAVANGVVFIGSYNGKLYALKARTGAKLWSYDTGGYVESSPAVANGVVYAGSWSYNVYALNARTGAKVWSYDTGGYVISSLAVADGMLYVFPYGQNVYAFGLPDDGLEKDAAERPDTATLRPDFRLKISKPVATPPAVH
jgi:outer membrane protein assembly factor BamB